MRADGDSSLIPSLNELKKRELLDNTQRNKCYERRCLRVKLKYLICVTCGCLYLSKLLYSYMIKVKRCLKRIGSKENGHRLTISIIMMEESDAESVVVQHKLKWQSKDN